MADISSIKLPDNSSYNIKDSSIYQWARESTKPDYMTSEINPIETRTYTNLIGSANDQAGASFYFGKIRPTTWNVAWRIFYRIRTYVPAYPTYDQISDVLVSGSQASLRAYSAFNTVGANYPAYYHNLYRLKEAGYTSGYSHLLGVGFRASQNPTNTSYKRTIVIELLKVENCTFTFYDTCKKYNTTDIPEAGTTNFDGCSEINYVSNGLQETADSNTVEDGSTYFSAKTGEKGIWATSLFMEDGNGTYQNICTASDGTVTSNNRTTATTKIANTNGFKVGGKVFFTTTNYAANSNITGWLVIYTGYSTFDSRYSFNTSLVANSLTPYAPIYLVGTIHSDGLFYLDSTWWTQTPTNTSKVYVLVGGCYDSTTSYCRITLYEHNPWYIYNGTRLEELKPYWANLPGSSTPQYNTTPEVASIKINGNSSATAASSENVSFVYNSTTKALDFIFV